MKKVRSSSICVPKPRVAAVGIIQFRVFESILFWGNPKGVYPLGSWFFAKKPRIRIVPGPKAQTVKRQLPRHKGR